MSSPSNQSSTLAQDIYKVITAKVDPVRLEEALKESLPILQGILSRRLDSTHKEPERVLRLSSIGDQCARKIQYQYHSTKGEELAPHTLLKFLYGDLVEWLLLFLVSLTDHKVEHKQAEVELGGVKGHIDAVIDGQLFDIKSANSRGFVKFKEHKVPQEDAFGYMSQLTNYLAAIQKYVTDPNKASFLAFDKELGHIVVDTYVLDSECRADFVKQRVKEVTSNALLPRGYDDVEFQKSGNRQLGLACRYCQFKQTCWPDLKTYLYSTGPVYLTHVAKEPNVPEVV